MKLVKVVGIGFLGVALGLIAYSPSVGATTFPGGNGAIAFSGMSTQGQGVWKVANIGGAKQLLAGSAHSPAWSPDGGTMVVVGKTDRGDDLQIMNADGSARRDLTPRSHGTESSPVWSADGQRIAFVREETVLFGLTRSAVMTITPDGSNERNVTGWLYSGHYASPSWSPDGRQLVYEKAYHGSRQLIIKDTMTSKGRTLTTLTDDVDSHVSWSPAGNKILYSDSQNEVYTIWTDGSHRTVISDGDSYDAAWSPDGKQIAFLEDKNGDEISISGEDGSVTQLPIRKESYSRLATPVWSPDGKKMVFAMQYGEAESQTSDIFTYDLRAGDPVPVWLASGNLSELTWQPLQ